MSSLNYCIKFQLDIKDPNIFFSDYFKKNTNGNFHEVYVAKLIQPARAFCHSSNLKHNSLLCSY